MTVEVRDPDVVANVPKRWRPKKMHIFYLKGVQRWWAWDECEEGSIFDTHAEAWEWAFRHWDWCYGCDTYTPWGGAEHYDEHDVCRNCGHMWGEYSPYQELVEKIATLLHGHVYGYPIEDAEPDVFKNYVMDAQDIIALNLHLLPLNVREAMFVEDN